MLYEPFAFSDLAFLAVPLPDDIASLRMQGRFPEEIHRIDEMLPLLPDETMRRRLTMEKWMAQGMMECYTLSEAELLRRLTEVAPAFTTAHLRQVMDIGHADYIRTPDGFVFEGQAYANIVNCCGGLLWSLNHPGETPPAAEDTMRAENIRYLLAHGERAVRYTVRASIQPAENALRPGETLRAWLPFPLENEQQTDIRLLSSSHPVRLDGDEIRTAYAEFPWDGTPLTIEYAYTRIARYTEVTAAGVSAEQPAMPAYLGEEYPHIVFTPYLRLLEREITGGDPNPLIRAQRIYRYITRNVRYSYMREYKYIDNIPMFCALNRRGDCGVQALLFITLARISGIPAKWESGNYIHPGHIGSHDWARFYIAPYGWLQCDPSFGGGAYGSGNAVGEDFYFCHEDVFRHVTCAAFQRQLTPAKTYMRLDPYDNQSGEAEYTHAGLESGEVIKSKEVLSAEFL